MNGLLLLNLWLLGYFFVVIEAFLGLQWLRPVPETQSVHENEDVVIDCIGNTYGKVHWQRSSGLPLPKQAKQRGGRLIIKGIKYSDAGWYVCSSEDRKTQAEARVIVHRRTTVKPKFYTSVETSRSWFTHEYSSTRGLHTSPPYLVSTPYPCLYGVCNGTCCESTSLESFFDCANGQKINKTLMCNRVNDCEDGSDESVCAPWPSKITVLPKHRVDVYCGDRDEKSGTLILECESVGYPTPLIRWKKYDGHVPTKCQQYSKGGHGVLTCPNFQQSDQGAYSCVAENSVNSAESQPKSLAKCSNTIHCPGFRVVNEEQLEYCLECYCSGKSKQCQNIKSNPTVIEIPFPESQTEIFAKSDGEIVFVPTKTELTPSLKIRQSAQEITYCSLSDSELQETSLLKSFGRSIIIPRQKGKINFLNKAPDLILRGNGLSLMYRATLLSPPKKSLTNLTNIFVRLWPGNWHHLNKETATRQDIMRVLSKVESLFIRCEYQQGHVLNVSKNAIISIESSSITDFTNSVSYVEKCNCPTGYEGLSCETCAAGYIRKAEGSDFLCEKVYVPPPKCDDGYIGANCSECDTAKGFHPRGGLCSDSTCHPAGSTSRFPDVFGKCDCKEGVTGIHCDRCESDSFHLHEARGCLKCWCNGVTNQCTSSNLYKSVISNIPRGGYNSSDGRNFWLLPSDFSGNRLTSYGGHLNYTMRYAPGIPKEISYLTVEFLCMNDVTLIYTHKSKDPSVTKEEKSWFVPLTETDWKKSDKTPVTREEFLSVLSKIKAIYIESPYHLSSGQANLTSARMSSATPTGDYDSELAVEVERCTCPVGYTGLSCETCSEGYYKKRNGTLTQCIKCNCTYCDPEFGCPDCPQLTYRDNPEREKMPVCKPCPCNGNGVSCVKDDHNQIFCRCKSGFKGMHCENVILEESNELTMKISPRRVRGKRVGTIVQFNCSVMSNEDLTVTAKKSFLRNAKNDSKILTRQGSKVSENFEVVLEPEMEAVECLAHDAGGKLAGRVMAVVDDLITVVKPVKITDCYSDVIDVKESESKDIICQTTGSPTPVVNWYKSVDGLPATKVDTSDGVHTIESASLRDNGTIYTCIAENSEGDKATCTKVLIVRKKCEVITVFPKEVIAKEGDNITIRCKTTAKSQVSWGLYNSLEVQRIFSSRINVQSGDLRINNATSYESGTYICTALGENGMINETVSVTVEEKSVPPTVVISEYDKTLREGENVSVSCTATGSPAPVTTWTKLHDTFAMNVHTDGKILTITNATPLNSGIYECEGRSAAGSASSYISIEVKKVGIPPRVNISEVDVKAHVGDIVTITCLAIGYPRPILSWYSPNVTLTNTLRENDSMVLLEPQESVKEEVSFTVTKEMDDLKVICFAENSAGRDQKFTSVKILQSKGGINETVERVPIGSFIELHCDFPGDPKWEKSGGLVGDECPILNALMIKSVQIQHNGTYRCTDGTDTIKIINLMVVGFVPKFSRASGSYLVLPVKLRSPKNIRVEIAFKTTNVNGVILQEENNQLDIYLQERKIHVSVFSREEDFLDVAMKHPIVPGRWYSMIVSIQAYVDITIYNENSTIHDRKTERYSNFTMGFGGENFFVGGSIPKGRHLRRFLQRRYPHFDGCISRLIIDRHEFDMVREGSHSRNVTLCRRCFEERDLCSKRGRCLDAPTQYGFTCVCPADQENEIESCPPSCVGKGCETELDLCALLQPCGRFGSSCTTKVHSLQCHCPYGYSGTTCEKVQEHSFCSKGNGYVKLPSKLLVRRPGKPEVIRMGFTLHQPSGQLLWQGDRDNHLSIAVRDRTLRYVYLNQNSKLHVHVKEELALDLQHVLSVTRLNNTAILELTRLSGSNSISSRYSNATTKVHTNRVVGDIYLGNVPNLTHHIGHHLGLSGCIHFIAFDGSSKINFPEVEAEKFNVSPPQRLQEETNSSEESNTSEEDVDSEPRSESWENSWTFSGTLNNNH